jgi:hypothetical protein
MNASQAATIARFSASSGGAGRAARVVSIHCFFRAISLIRVRISCAAKRHYNLETRLAGQRFV